MRTGEPLSHALSTLRADRHALRGEHAPALVVAALHQGAVLWEMAVSAFDQGAGALDVVDGVDRALAPGPELAGEFARARERAEHALPVAVDRFMLAVEPVLGELEARSQAVVGKLRKAAGMERKSQSRWRGSERRATLLVERDLVVEEVRVAIAALLDEVGAAKSALDKFLARSPR
ncbi:hypothetical protein [Actinokineospora bangkokensis]|uniref:Uncharacterized protein n=1 Tax=Actinokineospora bangkokensis TaxID=1193682 RepID=A0A1Q9LQE5_9PSEU|nr:hypothetical protein [Actinokineospora bangkokensis]OLR94242.1 hypothetical protein BJP25_10670 [Actinokineospora bangkokensis]